MVIPEKNHTSLTEEIGNYPLFYPPQIPQFNSPTTSQTIFSLLPSRQQKCFRWGEGGVWLFSVKTFKKYSNVLNIYCSLVPAIQAVRASFTRFLTKQIL